MLTNGATITEFEKRGVKTIGLSCNELKSHGDWIAESVPACALRPCDVHIA